MAQPSLWEIQCLLTLTHQGSPVYTLAPSSLREWSIIRMCSVQLRWQAGRHWIRNSGYCFKIFTTHWCGRSVPATTLRYVSKLRTLSWIFESLVLTYHDQCVVNSLSLSPVKSCFQVKRSPNPNKEVPPSWTGRDGDSISVYVYLWYKIRVISV